METQVEYKTKLPAEKLPYYRMTIFMNEYFDDPDLISWFEWLKDKHVPCCIAMGTTPGAYGKLAVWVWGKEHGEQEQWNNVESIGRVVLASDNWPESYGVENYERG